jgi:hypothetical protein
VAEEVTVPLPLGEAPLVLVAEERTLVDRRLPFKATLQPVRSPLDESVGVS